MIFDELLNRFKLIFLAQNIRFSTEITLNLCTLLNNINQWNTIIMNKDLETLRSHHSFTMEMFHSVGSIICNNEWTYTGEKCIKNKKQWAGDFKVWFLYRGRFSDTWLMTSVGEDFMWRTLLHIATITICFCCYFVLHQLQSVDHINYFPKWQNSPILARSIRNIQN